MMDVVSAFSRVVFTLSLLAIASCSSGESIIGTNPRIDETQTTRPAVSLCELIRSPYQHHQKVVQLNTTLYRVGPIIAFGDENCVQRHSLFDISFNSDMKSSVCSGAEKRDEVCRMVTGTKEKSEKADYEVLGTFVGYFEYYETGSGFTSSGLRFRFTVAEIANIERIQPIESKSIERLR